MTMKLKYVGPHVTIDRNGMTFDHDKEDKYVYLNAAIQLMKALSPDNLNLVEKTFRYEAPVDQSFRFDVNETSIPPSELEMMAKNSCPLFDDIVDHAIKHAELYLENATERAKHNKIISDIGREAMLKNIGLMRDYIIQRSINNDVYECIVEQLAEMVKDEHIDYIVVPLWKRFALVLRQVEKVLINQRFPIFTKGESYVENGQIYFKMSVVNIES
jgi:hypothetical protein